jgi:hypothetical protein
MSLDAFQQAIADLVASPSMCVAVRGGAPLLDAYQLDAREKRRLLAMVEHRGMSQNCTLYRANRLTPIARSLPRTCVMLGSRLAAELEAFWAAEPDSELQFKREAERFGGFLLKRLQAGAHHGILSVADVEAELQSLGVRFGADFHP